MRVQQELETKTSDPDAPDRRKSRGSRGQQGGQKARQSADRYKIQIQLSERAKNRLFELVEKTEAESAAQVVRDALRIYDVLLDEVEQHNSELYMKDGESGDIVRLKLF